MKYFYGKKSSMEYLFIIENKAVYSLIMIKNN
jgi:hypothetical protein